ncbi:MAG: 3-deoxy-7-phosphoheptulonate synthase [Elusimicrobia bacterium]|nr:3-deoxy-7-phosphoheptulonate synthase [Elusimicrobiota bacterium]
MTPSKDAVVIVSIEDGRPPRSLRSLLKGLGLRDPGPRCRWHGPNLLSIRVDGTADAGIAAEFRDLDGVRDVAVVPLERGLVGRQPGQADLSVELPGGERIGEGPLSVIAGPCSVESLSQICEIAASVKEAGASALRGGAFKPRTSPYAFGGLGEAGLEHMARARELTKLPIVTEVLNAGDLDLVARYADVLQIGSRNMQNSDLLLEAGRHRLGKPVLLKRSFGATIEEFLQAAEYVALGRWAAGHKDCGLILCERGIRTFETSTRFSLDVGAVAVLRERTALPIIVDPSHAAGARRYVPPLACAAAAAGARGVMVVVHGDPDHAWSDSRQSLDLPCFRRMVAQLRPAPAARA